MTRARKRSSKALSVIAVATVVAAACGIGVATRLSGGGAPIRIGVVAPLTGPSASVGRDIVRAARLAVAQINQHGGLLDGRKAELVVADDACDTKKGAAAVRRLMAQHVMSVVGGACSGAALPETAITDKAGIPFIADAQTNAMITRRRLLHVFRTIGSDEDQGEFAASYLVSRLKAKRVAVVGDSSAYSTGLARSVDYNLRQLGSTTVSSQSFTPGTRDFAPLLARVKAAAPQAVYFAGYYSDAGLFIRQARGQGIGVPLLGGDATVETSVITTAGTSAEGFTATTSPSGSLLKSPAAKTFARDYREMFHTEPGSYAPYEYDAVNILAWAVKSAGSPDPEAVTSALNNVYRFKGVTGEISFEATGDRLLPVYMTTVVRKGRFVPGMTQTPDGIWTRAD